jgi:hypothetical protein
MRTKILKGLMAITSVLAMGTLTTQAFSLSKFTYTSRLSTGKWVKVAVPADGIYQITFDQLSEMGFENPQHIQIYGCGGHIIGEVLDGNTIDDLQPAPTMLTDNKVIFYAQGPVERKMMNNTNVYPYYTHKVNGYSNYGYYFITETDSPVGISQQTPPTPGNNWVTSSYSLFTHESELSSPGMTGKQLLGESLLPDGVTFDYYLPQLCNNTIVVHLGAAAHVTNQVVYASAEIVGEGSIAYTTTENKIRAVSNTDVQRHYNTTYPARSYQLVNPSEHGQIHVSIYNPWDASINMAQLDFVDLTYKRQNSFAANENYFSMGLAMTNENSRIVMPETDSTLVVWDVSNTQNARQMVLTPAIDEQGDTVGMSFTPGTRTQPSLFYAFKPQEELPTIASSHVVGNQNLHGLTTPDMLIVTNEYFMPEAERLAQMHRDHDGMTVHVVDQEQVFHEFSSGTPDASAIRLLCKMLYDRNSTKFKHLLMFGPASYDYRGITTSKANRVITYETDNGDSDQYSYGTDDFFGMLADNSGSDLTTSDLMLGVGRLTPTDLTQARQNVDKIMQYVLTPDYGTWRNHYTIWADNGDYDLHQLQGERIDNIIQNKQHIPMVADKTFIDMFPKEGNVSSEARRHVIDLLNAGQFYGTYMGHANPKSLTSSRMWTMSNIRNQSYAHQPIFMTACCDVARFDSNEQGIAEIMFHQPNGGAIAVLTASREVDAKSNDYLNQAFTDALFSYNNTGQMTTLGQAYMKSKRAPITNASDTSRYNKMAFLLLGDPAMKVLYPKPLFNITTVNGISVKTTDNPIALSPMQQVTVEADVLQAGTSQVNSSFNGDATLSVYDCKRLLKYAEYTNNYSPMSGNIYYPRDLLVEVKGRVENGHFVGTAVVPRYFKAQPGEQLAIHVYAHKDNSTDMVNGVTTQVVAAAYDEQTAVQDGNSPIIEQMYLNEQGTFDLGGAVPENSILHATATDDVAFNNQSMGVGCIATLQLDNGATNYTNIKNFVNISDGGKMLQLDFPINGLTPGQHSLTFSVQDVAGNVTQRTITFMVGGQNFVSLKTTDLVAIEEANIELDQTDQTDQTSLSAMVLKVVNARGELVWSTDNASLPYTWNLTNNQGERVTPGLYKMFGQFNDGASYGGTNIMPIIVMDPVKQLPSSSN